MTKSFPTRRLAGFVVILILVFLSFIGETFRVAILKNDYYRALAKDQQIITADIAPKRGVIYLTDPVSPNSKTILAESVERFALAVTPKNVPPNRRKEIAHLIDPYVGEKNQNEIIKVFEKNSLYAPPLAHGLVKKEVEEIAQKIDPKIKLNFDAESGNIIYFTNGIMFLREFDRFYPEDNLLSQIVGFVNYQGEGKYGLEGFYNNELRGTRGSVALEKDNQGELLQEVGAIQRENGAQLSLTIDLNIQYFVEKRLAKAMEDYKAESGTVIIMEPGSGAVLALANLPDYNPNEFAKTEYEKFMNPAINKQYEAGSVMKPFTIAAALDLGVIDKEMKNDFPSSVTIGSYTISNVADKSYPNTDIIGILDNSINTGTVWVAEKLGNEHFYNYLKNFGFGAKTSIDLTGEIEGELPDWKKWKDIHRATISFGQGDAVTPIQLITGYNVIANNGILMRPFILKEKVNAKGEKIKTEPQEVRRVISENTALELRKMLQHVVEYGHAKHAAVTGFSIGGKTGTAQIPLPEGGYSEDQTIQTFAGMGPISDPKFVILVVLHKPNTQYADSSTVYVFSDIAKFILNYWQIKPIK